MYDSLLIMLNVLHNFLGNYEWEYFNHFNEGNVPLMLYLG